MMKGKVSRARFAASAIGTALILSAAAGALAQQERERPIPRLANGHVSFGPAPGETGVWDAFQSRLVVNPDAYDARNTATHNAPMHIDDVPLQPWARALTNYRHAIFIASEPYTRCKPTGGPRQIMSPYGLEIVEIPELERLYFFNVANSMSYRVVFMDGREHPENLTPTYFGHSVGHWEGDTLVVDTVGMNERNWMNRDALPHTERLHLIERFTRTSYDRLEYEVTIDDPGAYTAPWTSGHSLEWIGDMEVFEYVCQENNLSPESMLGEGRMSRIVP